MPLSGYIVFVILAISKRCDCGFQLKHAMKMIATHGSGALFYLANHEGRCIGENVGPANSEPFIIFSAKV